MCDIHRLRLVRGLQCTAPVLSTPLCGCLQIVKLSDAVQEMPRSVTQFVHGVPGSFLAVGEAKAKPPADGGPRFTKGAYFIGKVCLLNCFSGQCMPACQ